MKKNLAGILLSILSFFVYGSYNPQGGYGYDLIRTIESEKNIRFSRDNIYIPYERELREMENGDYDSLTNNCVDKSLKYHNLLKENGEISYIVKLWTYPSKLPHARVYVLNKEKGTWHSIDPTWKDNEDGLDIANFSYDYILNIFKRETNIKKLKNGGSCLKTFPENYEKYKKFRRGERWN